MEEITLFSGLKAGSEGVTIRFEDMPLDLESGEASEAVDSNSEAARKLATILTREATGGFCKDLVREILAAE